MKGNVGAVLALALACFGPALAATANPEEGPPPFERRHGPPPIDRILERHAEELGLSEEVHEQVRAIAAQSEQEEAPLREALHAQRDALHELLAQDAPEPDAVMHQAEVVGAAEVDLHKQRLRTLLAVRALLTPEQRQQLVKIFEEKRRTMRHHRWGGPPPDGPEPPAPPEN
jgi:Spy/CpxP family protein refolding chaperone